MQRLISPILLLLTMLIVSGCGLNVNTGGNTETVPTSASSAVASAPTAAGPSSADIQATVEASVNATQAALKPAAPTSAPAAAPTQTAIATMASDSATETLPPGKYYIEISYGMVNGQPNEKLRNRQFEAELIIAVK